MLASRRMEITNSMAWSESAVSIGNEKLERVKRAVSNSSGGFSPPYQQFR
jgi:hypothetical protein